MEATVARIRDYVRRQVSGDRVWRVGVKVTRENVLVRLYTPDKPDRLLAAKGKTGISTPSRIESELKTRLGREVSVEVAQAPTAVAKFVRISPRKVRHVVDVVRGKPVSDALAILQFVPNSAAQTLTKLIKSAVANAENNHRLDADTLEIMHAHVDEGPTLKRISPRAMGRAYRIMKRTSHITIGLAESDKPAKPAASGKGVARTAGPRPAAKAPRVRRTAKAAPAQSEETTAPETTEREGGE